MENALGEKLRINELYDVYGGLLTAKQRRYLEYYYRDDYSLSEIAGLTEVSRNAVHDQLRIATEHMETYEAALGVVRMRKAAAGLLARLAELGIDDPVVIRHAADIDRTE